MEAESQKPQPQAMEDVNHPSNTCVLPKGYQPLALVIQQLLIVNQPNALGREGEADTARQTR